MARWSATARASAARARSARADADGSSDSLLMRLPLVSCCCARLSSLWRCCSVLTPVSNTLAVEMRAIIEPQESIRDVEQGVEQRLCHLQHLGRGLVALLIQHQLGRFLIEVDAGAFRPCLL